MSFVRRVNRAQLQLHAVTPRCGVNPAGWIAFTKDVGHGRKVHEMQAGIVLRNFPVMCVTIKPRLHLAPRADDFHQCENVLQSGDLPVFARIMMDENHSGFVAVRVERFGKPLQLFCAQ